MCYVSTGHRTAGVQDCRNHLDLSSCHAVLRSIASQPHDQTSCQCWASHSLRRNAANDTYQENRIEVIMTAADDSAQLLRKGRQNCDCHGMEGKPWALRWEKESVKRMYKCHAPRVGILTASSKMPIGTIAFVIACSHPNAILVKDEKKGRENRQTTAPDNNHQMIETTPRDRVFSKTKP
eukprot:2740920-Rhodomonas_salina.1